MKWVFLIAAVLLAPIVFGLIRSDRRNIVRVCFVLGVSIFLLGPSLWSAPIAWPTWPAPTKGTEVSFIDSIALALLLSMPKVRIPTSIKVSYLLICLALFVSTCVAYNRIAALFYVWQLLRATLLFVAIARTCANEPRAATALVSGMSLGIIGEAAWVVLQYAQHVDRPGGSFGHSNTMGIAANYAVFPALALMLGSRRWFLPGGAVLSGLVCVLLGGSRASMGMFAIGVFVTVILSIIQQSSSRKYVVLGALALLAIGAAPAMMWSLSKRSPEATASSDRDRAAMKDAASMVIADHPLGVGANQYVIVSNTGGYSERAGVPWNEDNLRAPVHDTYYLVTAELGFIGLFGMLTLFGSFILLGLTALRSDLPDGGSQLAPGLLAAVIIVAIQISYEFAFMEFTIHDLFAVNAGVLVAILARAKSLAKTSSKPSVRPEILSHAN